MEYLSEMTNELHDQGAVHANDFERMQRIGRAIISYLKKEWQITDDEEFRTHLMNTRETVDWDMILCKMVSK